MAIFFTFTTLWANSADHKLMIFLLLFPKNRIRHFMQIGDLFSLTEKYENYFKILSAEILT